jgi:hypothetical protein
MDLKEDLIVRFIVNDDIPVIERLLQDIFDDWPGVPTGVAAIDHLRWKLGDGRQGFQAHYVSEIDGRLVAFQLNLHWQMKAGDRVLVVRRGWDSGVHPQYQGKGLMSIMRPRMHEQFGETPDLFLGAGGHQAFSRITRDEDRRPFAHKWLVYVRPLTLLAALRTFKLRRDRGPKKLLRAVPPFLRWLAVEARERLAPQRAAFEIQTVELFDERIDAFCEEASQAFDFLSVRTAGLLNWRYADKRAGDFTIRLASERSQIVGFAVLCVAKDKGHIADIMAPPGRDDVVAALGRDAGRRLRGQAPLIECWLFSNSPYLRGLQRAGFLGSRRRRQPTFEAVGVPVEEVEFLSGKSIKAHLSLGDMDWV